MSTARPVARCISISFADSTGVAGIYGDLKTFSALDCYGTGVVTAIGSASARALDYHSLDTREVLSQLRSAIHYFGVDAVKVGYLANEETAAAITSEIVGLARDISVVIDPSLVDRDGRWKTERGTADILREQLFPHATVITPNIAEAQILTGETLETSTDVEDAGKHLLDLGPSAVLITGGHRNSAYSDDLLAWRKDDGSEIQLTWLRAARVGIDRIDGAGCTLTSGIAACLARNQPVPEATEEAKIYLTAALRAGSRWHTEQGSGPLHHFYAWWNQTGVDRATDSNL
ncbi:MAG: hydroxymethylpyrimidine/phosphomethylpyrimidine kinase [Spirochaetales bacterium]